MRFDRTLLHESFAARDDLYLATRCGREHATALRQRESWSWSRVAVGNVASPYVKPRLTAIYRLEK